MAGSPPKLEHTAEGDPLYPAGQILRSAGISRQQLYQYTALGLIGGIRFNKNGYRLYPKSVFRHLKLIRSLNRLGYTLADIKELFSQRLVSQR
ncbi:MAG: MerR family transcriptional regulator [Planctomycetes bacterium]|nr:MerR family transcriptional regulator [Planctomycetota bacterium]